MTRGRRKHKGGLVEVGTLLEGALQQLGMKGAFEKHRLEKTCREVLGEGFSRALTGVTVKGSALQLAFNHSIWMNEANFRKADILKKVQQALPQAGVRSITLTLSAHRKPSGK
jgi:hypothetical protein